MLRLTMKSAWTQLDFNQISHDTHNIYISNKKEIFSGLTFQAHNDTRVALHAYLILPHE